MRASTLSFVIGLLLVGCIACQDSSDTASSPLAKALESQKNAQLRGDSLNQRMKVRQVALDHIRSHYPRGEIQGVSIYANGGGGNDYVTGVDLKSSDKRYTIYVDVQLYVKENGDLYWKASFASPQQQEAQSSELPIEEK